MTKDHVLAVCRSNWEYRGVDDLSIREMLQELSSHLEDAEDAGRTAQDVVGSDIKAFAASWARARRPLPYRLLRMSALIPFVLAWLLLVGHALQWSFTLPVAPGRIAFILAIAAVTVAWELRRGSIGFRKGWLIAIVIGLPAAVITDRLLGDDPLFSLPLWGTLLLLLPGLPVVIADGRAKKKVEEAEAKAQAPEVT